MTHYVIKSGYETVHINAHHVETSDFTGYPIFCNEVGDVIAQISKYDIWYDYNYQMTPVYPTPTHNPWSGNNLSIADTQGGLISHSQVTWTSPSLEMDTYNPNQQLDLETDV